MIVLDWGPDECNGAAPCAGHSNASWSLVAPAPHHAPTIASWSESAAQADGWVSMAHDPFPPPIVAGWWEVEHASPWVLSDDEGVAVGYGEIWAGEDGIELARVIVDPEHRREGIGRRLVGELLAEGWRHGWLHCFVRVAPHNVAARRLYQASGFVEVGDAGISAQRGGHLDDNVWMRHESGGGIGMLRFGRT